jgi:hypothetical protein
LFDRSPNTDVYEGWCRVRARMKTQGWAQSNFEVCVWGHMTACMSSFHTRRHAARQIKDLVRGRTALYSRLLRAPLHLGSRTIFSVCGLVYLIQLLPRYAGTPRIAMNFVTSWNDHAKLRDVEWLVDDLIELNRPRSVNLATILAIDEDELHTLRHRVHETFRQI